MIKSKSMKKRGLKNFGDNVDGLLLLNKPSGMTSNRALQIVRRFLNAKKAGHTGSLDPAATGMLPLCFGQATKVCKYLLSSDKSYLVTAYLGVATHTGDVDGKEISTMPIPDKTYNEWKELIESFIGISDQVPPMFSALRVNGKRLHELARNGEIIDREARSIQIYSIEMLKLTLPLLIFRVRCSKGTYIRSLVEDIAKKAGTVAYTAKLHRESVGTLKSEGMIDMQIIESLFNKGVDSLRNKLLPVDFALSGMPQANINAEEAIKFCAGQELNDFPDKKDGLIRVYKMGQEFLGIGEVTRQRVLLPRRIFVIQEKTT
ncbi:MAG: tRNA pseudouridine(55) synthase TruB [Gammaproteobacteria bacterium]|nr:tRNA pseudouridine(55) synthase TruB [Gammaproteobacteria bacterium]